MQENPTLILPSLPNKRLFDAIILVFLFVLTFMTKIPTLNYPLQGDSVIYAELTQNIYQGKGYVFQDQPFTKYPPLFSLLSVPFFALFKNPVSAIKLSAFFWQSLTICLVYVLSRLFSLSRTLSVLTSLLVLFNPWFFYYTGVLPLSESLGLFLVMLGLLLFYARHYYFSSLILGFSLITRYTLGVFVIPLFVYYSIPLLKQLVSKNIDQNIFKKFLHTIVITVLTFLPLLIWVLFNLINKTHLFTQGYTPEVARFTQDGVIKVLPFTKAFGIFVAVIFPLVFLGLIVFIISHYINLFPHKKYKKKQSPDQNIFWKICFWAFLINIIFFSWWISIEQVFFPFIWERIRFIVPFIPVFTIFAMTKPLLWPNLFLKKIFSRKYFGFLTLVIFIILTSLLSYGSIKDSFDASYLTKDIYTQRSSHQVQAIDFINQNLELDKDAVPYSVIIIGILSSDSANEHKNYFLSEHFKKSILYLPVRIDPDEMLKEEINQTLSENPQLLDQPMYVLSEYSPEKTAEILKDKTTIPFQTLELVFAVKAEPKVSVNKIIK